jgi:ZIP family zinc transporter
MEINQYIHHFYRYLSINKQQWLAFNLAFIASMGTFIGGLLVVLFTRSSQSTFQLMGILQAFSAGVMLYITCFDLIPEAIEQIGTQKAMNWFFIGILIFGILELYIIPENHEEESIHAVAVGSPVIASTDSPNPTPQPSHKKGTTRSKSPRRAPKTTSKEKEKMLRTSFITFLALGLHNLPEGLGVYLSTLSNTRLGLQLAAGIMLHNIPEGMAVAIPLYAATKSHSKVLWWTLLNGLAEPLGVILGGAFLQPFISQALLSQCLAVVGGIMVCISIQ